MSSALVLALALGLLTGCGPAKSGAATPSQQQRSEYQATQADRAYWEGFRAAYRDGRGLNDYDSFCVLPIRGVTDPVLIDLHDTWVAFFSEWQEARYRAQAGGMGINQMLTAPTILCGQWLDRLQPKIAKARQRYGAPARG